MARLKLPEIPRGVVIELADDMWIANGKLVVASGAELDLSDVDLETAERLEPLLRRAVELAEKLAEEERTKVRELRAVKALLAMIGA